MTSPPELIDPKIEVQLRREITSPFDKLSRSLDWEFLRDIRTYPLVASMGIWIALVPLMAKLLSEVADIVRLDIGGQLITLHLSLPFAWQILFFAAVLMSAANLLVTLFCPKIIRSHKNYASFEAAGKTGVHLRDYEDYAVGQPKSRLKVPQRLAKISIQSTEGRDLKFRFWQVYEIQKYRNFPVRLFCTLLYLIGFIFVFDIFVRQVVWVLRSIQFNHFIKDFTTFFS